MEILTNLFFQTVPFILLITVLITIHEFGHYLAARYYGVAIQTFSVGFGKILWSKVDKRGVTWQVCLLPFGGYVRMASLDLLEYKLQAGHIDAQRFAALKPKTMEGQHTFGRIMIAFAGPFANILFGIIVLTGLFLYGGNAGEVVCVVPDSPADRAGVVSGDIVSQKGAAILFLPTDKNASWFMQRDGQWSAITQAPETVDFSPCFNTEELAKPLNQKSLGFTLKESSFHGIPLNFNQSLTKSVILTKDTFIKFLQIFPRIFTQKEAQESVGSIISVQQTFAAVSSVSIWKAMFLSAMLSVNLAALNLLPIPVLDGGHIVIALVEGVTKKRLSQKIKSIIFIFGLAFVIFLFMFVLKLDIIRFISR